MKPAPFAFVRPQGLQHALEALAADPGAKVLAGGQSLVPLLSMRLAAPSTLVDINALPDLDHVRVDDAGVHVGALARHADVLASEEVRRAQPLVSFALENVAHATIRNRGTTVGSIVHADAAAEMPMVLALLDGSVSVASTSGTRTIPASELYAGPLESTLHHDEIALEATFPALAPGEGVGFAEIARRHGDYALVGVGAVVRVDGEAVTSARLGYLSAADVPIVVDVTAALVEEVAQRPSTDPLVEEVAQRPSTDPLVEEVAQRPSTDPLVEEVAQRPSTDPLVEEVAQRPSRDQGPLADAALAAAAETALEHLDPADDLHATAAYRTQLVRVLTARVLRAAYADALDRAGAGRG